MSVKHAIHPVSQRRIPTDDELMDLPKDGYKRELLNGEIVMSPAWSEHGRLIMRFAVSLAGVVYANRLGELFDGQTGFRMKSLDVLSPDISFITRERLIRIGGNPEGFFEGAPDLAIEFLSPSESNRRLKQKLTQYFENGTTLAWVMDPQKKSVAVYRDVEPYAILNASDTLTGDPLVKEFVIAVSEIFAGID